MNTRIRNKLLIFIALASMLLSACGKNTGNEQNDDAVGTAYTVNYMSLPKGMSLSILQYSEGEDVFLCGMNMTCKPLLIKYSDSGEFTYPLPDEVSYVYACCKSGEGLSVIAGDRPSGWYNAQGEYSENLQESYRIYLLVYDNAGNLNEKHPLEAPFDTGMIVRSIRWLDGAYYVLSYTRLIQLDGEGRVLNENFFEASNYIAQTIIGDRLAVCLYSSSSDGGDDSTKVELLSSAENFSFEEYASVGSWSVVGIGASANGKLLINRENTLYELNAENGAETPVYDFYASGVSNTDYSDIYPYGSGYLLSNLRQQRMVHIIPGEASEKIPLRLWTRYQVDDELASMIDLFNQSSPKYRIVIETEESIGAEQLRAKIMAGQGPDLYSVDDEGGFYGFSEDAVFEDLLPYMQSETWLNEQSIVAPLFNALTADGKLYSLPLSFMTATTAGRKDAPIDAGASLLEQQGELELLGDDLILFPAYQHGGQIWLWFRQLYVSANLDVENAVCNFDTSDYRNILEYCAESFRSGETEITNFVPSVYMTEYIPGTLRLLYLQQQFGDNLLLNTEFDSAFMPGGSLAVSNTSLNKDGAMEFLEFAYNCDLNDKEFSWPASSARLEALLLEATTDGIWDTEFHEYQQLSENTVSQFRELLNCTHGIIGKYPEISEIMNEEARKSFLGDRSIEETISVTQSRVDIFISERFG